MWWWATWVGCGAEEGVVATVESPPCKVTRYADTSERWELPGELVGDLPATPAFSFTTCDGGPGHTGYWYRNATADKLRDFVFVDQDCIEPPLTGAEWIVVEGRTGTRSTWKLPLAGTSADGTTLVHELAGANGVVCAGGTEGKLWVDTAADLTGDGVLDLVVRGDDCSSDPTLGVDHWLVYAGTGEGFASAPTVFSLRATTPPAAEGERPFTYNLSTLACGTYYWDRVHLVGDARPDLVVFQNTCDDPGVGVDHWVVHETVDGGVDKPIHFSLPVEFTPAPGAVVTTYALDQVGTCGSEFARLNHHLDDRDGDGLPDLLVQEGCDERIDDAHWATHRGTPTGFEAEPTIVAVAPLLDECTENWQLTDQDGDGTEDVVVLRDCKNEVGRLRWDVYPGTAEGFASSPVAFPLPDLGLDRDQFPFGTTDNVVRGSCGGMQWWSWTDLDGDGVRDLYVSKDACDPEVGYTHWRVHPAICEPD